MIFVEVTVADPSDFEVALDVHGEVLHGQLPRDDGGGVVGAQRAGRPVLHVRDETGATPHLYFEWTEGNPASQLLRFLLFGHGEVAPVTREVLRRAEPDRERRPHVHVG